MSEKVHVIRVQTPTYTVALVTKPTTTPVEWFEEDARSKYRDATLKPSRSYDPTVFDVLESTAEEQGLTVDEVIDLREAKSAPSGGE